MEEVGRECMKISIVIPNFNKSKFLDECIMSALDQTYKDIEIVFVDDCSTDNSLEIAGKYLQFPNFKIVKNPENMGISKTLNNAVRNSTGEYISWLSSDDKYCIDKIEENVKHIKDCDFVYSDYYTLTEDSRIENVYKLNHCKVENELFNSHFINGCSVMFSRKIYDFIGGFDEVIGGKSGYCADTLMWHKMSFYGKYKLIQKPLVYYRLSPTQTGNNITDNFKIDTKKEYFKTILNWAKENGFSR